MSQSIKCFPSLPFSFSPSFLFPSLTLCISPLLLSLPPCPFHYFPFQFFSLLTYIHFLIYYFTYLHSKFCLHSWSPLHEFFTLSPSPLLLRECSITHVPTQSNLTLLTIPFPGASKSYRIKHKSPFHLMLNKAVFCYVCSRGHRLAHVCF